MATNKRRNSDPPDSGDEEGVATTRPREPSSKRAPSSEGPPSEDAPSKRKSGWPTTLWRWTKRLVVLGVVLALIGAAGLWWVLSRYEKDLPSTAELRNYEPPQVTRVLARDGTLLAELFVQRRTVVPIAEIPAEMKIAVLAAEDADFYQHEGLDYFGMLRALYVNVRSGKAKQGASTITQQVIKNVLLTPERTFERKARELLLARRIEQELTKDEILELYLNHIYFGHGRYGIEEAARYYFGKSVRKVTLGEAALLAGLAKGPNLYSPRVNMERARGRRDYVLGQIAAKQFAAAERAEEAKRAPIVLVPAVEALPELAPEAVDEVRRTLNKRYGMAARRGGFVVSTTIDPQQQALARRALRDNLDAYAKRHKLVAPLRKPKGKRRAPFQGTPSGKGHKIYRAVVLGADDEAGRLKIRIGTVDGYVPMKGKSRYNPKELPPSKFAEAGALLRVSAVLERGIGDDGVPREYRLELGPQSAIVVLDVKSREIRAIAGSYEAVRGGLDRATFARRQPGSTFKPFVYSYGIHSRRLTPASVVDLLPPGALPPEQPPPALLLRQAVARSVNKAALWALREVGPESVVSWAQAMGIRSPMKPTASLALGAYEVTPRELAGAYATFASGGVYADSILITRIVGPDGVELELPTLPPKRRVMEEDEAYIVTSMLTSVVRYGTGRKAAKLGLPLAGKTGTTNDAKDGWFAGYTPETVCVVWTGFDDSAPLGAREAGSSAALPAFISFMGAAHAKNKPPPFRRPAGVIEVAIDPATGQLAYEGQEDAIREIFLTGTEPVVVAEPPDAGADADVDGGEDAGDEDAGDGGAGGANTAGAGGANAAGAGGANAADAGGDTPEPTVDTPDAGSGGSRPGAASASPPAPPGPTASAALPDPPPAPPSASADPPPF